MKLSVDGHDLPFDVHDGFDQIPEAPLGHDLDLVEGDRGVDDLHGVFVTHISLDKRPERAYFINGEQNG
jgi:hypothetical protein